MSCTCSVINTSGKIFTPKMNGAQFNIMGLKERAERLKYMFDALNRQRKKYERLRMGRGLSRPEYEQYTEIIAKLENFNEKCKIFIRPRKNGIGKFSVEDYISWSREQMQGQGATPNEELISSVYTFSPTGRAPGPSSIEMDCMGLETGLKCEGSRSTSEDATRTSYDEHVQQQDALLIRGRDAMDMAPGSTERGLGGELECSTIPSREMETEKNTEISSSGLNSGGKLRLGSEKRPEEATEGGTEVPYGRKGLGSGEWTRRPSEDAGPNAELMKGFSAEPNTRVPTTQPLSLFCDGAALGRLPDELKGGNANFAYPVDREIITRGIVVPQMAMNESNGRETHPSQELGKYPGRVVTASPNGHPNRTYGGNGGYIGHDPFSLNQSPSNQSSFFSVMQGGNGPEEYRRVVQKGQTGQGSGQGMDGQRSYYEGSEQMVSPRSMNGNAGYPNAAGYMSPSPYNRVLSTPYNPAVSPSYSNGVLGSPRMHNLMVPPSYQGTGQPSHSGVPSAHQAMQSGHPSPMYRQDMRSPSFSTGFHSQSYSNQPQPVHPSRTPIGLTQPPHHPSYGTSSPYNQPQTSRWTPRQNYANGQQPSDIVYTPPTPRGPSGPTGHPGFDVPSPRSAKFYGQPGSQGFRTGSVDPAYFYPSKHPVQTQRFESEFFGQTATAHPSSAKYTDIQARPSAQSDPFLFSPANSRYLNNPPPVGSSPGSLGQFQATEKQQQYQGSICPPSATPSTPRYTPRLDTAQQEHASLGFNTDSLRSRREHYVPPRPRPVYSQAGPFYYPDPSRFGKADAAANSASSSCHSDSGRIIPSSFDEPSRSKASVDHYNAAFDYANKRRNIDNPLQDQSLLSQHTAMPSQAIDLPGSASTPSRPILPFEFTSDYLSQKIGSDHLANDLRFIQPTANSVASFVSPVQFPVTGPTVYRYSTGARRDIVRKRLESIMSQKNIEMHSDSKCYLLICLDALMHEAITMACEFAIKNRATHLSVIDIKYAMAARRADIPVNNSPAPQAALPASHGSSDNSPAVELLEDTTTKV